MGAIIMFARKSKNQCLFYLLPSYELSAYFRWFAVNKLMRMEVFHTGLVYYP